MAEETSTEWDAGYSAGYRQGNTDGFVAGRKCGYLQAIEDLRNTYANEIRGD